MSREVDRIIALIDDGLLEHGTQRSPEGSNEFPFLLRGPTMADLRDASLRQVLAPVMGRMNEVMQRITEAVRATGVSFEDLAEAIRSGCKLKLPPVPAKSAHRRRYSR